MADDLSDFIATRAAGVERPLQGLTVLVVEDSRFACEAMRLMCLRSGARIRRADCLRSAHRHLQSYRPTVAIVDLGLPDGSGLDLIASLAGHHPRIPAILGTSGDGAAEGTALAAGADGFLAKPLDSLSAFQDAILAALPAYPRPAAHVPGAADRIAPDPLALHDDLVLAAGILGHGAAGAELDYVAQFLAGVAITAHDGPLQAAAEALARDRQAGRATSAPVNRISGLVRDRLAACVPF